MKKYSIGLLLMLLGLSSAASYADVGMLQIGCTGDAEGARVEVNGRFRGVCPINVEVPVGNVSLNVLKRFDATHQWTFSELLSVASGSVKKIDLSLRDAKLDSITLMKSDLRNAAEWKAAVERKNKQVAALKERNVLKAVNFRDCPTCPEMVVIPSGQLMMGGESSQFSEQDEKAHSVTIAYPLAVGKYEVTQGQWKAIMGKNPSYFKNCGDGCPVEQVSWEDAQNFLQKLSAKTSKEYRLLSESEWEYACQAGVASIYCGGNNPDFVAWFSDNSDSQTHPVGLKQENAFGLFDMSGNVREWVQDCYGDYKAAPTDGSAKQRCTELDGRVLRGGSWFGQPQSTRTSNRDHIVPTFQYNLIGFRVARTLLN